MIKLSASAVRKPAFWSTASFGETADTTPMELSALGEHLDACKRTRGRLHDRLFALAESADGFISTRFVTTLVVVAFIIGVTSLVA
jgi:hypothetical protein